jgi:hypothetical protein
MIMLFWNAGEATPERKRSAAIDRRTVVAAVAKMRASDGEQS